MIPVEQKRLTPEQGGDCQAACIASILEVPLDQVPQIDGPEGLKDEGWSDYNARTDRWLAERGLSLVTFSLGSNGWIPKGYAILGALSPRFPGLEHAVVIYDGEIVWDPHPGREQGVGEWRSVDIFQALDPGKLR